MGEVQGELNRINNTFGVGEAAAANDYAGTTGLETVAALNRAAGITNPANYLDLAGVCNLLAGTTGLEPPGALAQLGDGFGEGLFGLGVFGG